MANISDSVCPNHPDTPAVTRCATCGKPVCGKCVVRRDGADYCSESCAAGAQSAAGRVSSVMESKKKSESSKRIRTIIVLIILIAAAAGGYAYYKKNKSKVDSTFQSTLQKTQSTISSEAKKAKASVDKSMPGDSNYKKKRENLVK